MAIPTIIKNLANDVRNKIYGKDVRESIAKGMEESGDIADNAHQTSIDAVDRVSIYKSQFDQSILDGDQPAEVQTLRVDPLSGETYNTAADRFEANQIQTKESIDRHTLDLTSKSLNVLLFGAVGDGETDDTTAILNAIATAPDRSTVFVPHGNFITTQEILIDKPINFIMDGEILSDHEGTAIKLDGVGRGGGNSSRFILKASKKNKNLSMNSIGINVHNSYHNEISIPHARNFTENVLFSASDGAGTVYNQTTLGEIYGGKIQVRLTADNKSRGWTNQNNFFGGRLYHGSSDENRDGFIQVLIDGEEGTDRDFYRNNGNNFYGTALEDVGVNGEYAVAVECNGTFNSFNDIRTEGSMKWILGESSYRNFIGNGTYLYKGNIDDRGGFNRIETVGTGSKNTLQSGTNEFIAGANGTTGATFEGNGNDRIPAKFYNRGGGNAPAFYIMEPDGETVAAQLNSSGSWTVKGGSRKVHFGAHVTHPASGGQRGDISFIANSTAGGPIGYICYSSADGGLWRPFGATIQKPATPHLGMSHEAFLESYIQLIDRMKVAGIIRP